ncbi:MAG: alcohol dehydrogenase catalytic domain-containing protein [Candidatus Lokiarchaeota archaeon]|nr:alcohol dehydrogenase catalytic domain-containing protein [Candidatus Lokiarchaeota archaeon]
MRIARYFSNDDIKTDEMPKPIIGSEEFLVKVKKSGICGSDILEYYRKAKMKKLGVDSLILGHEIAGDIVEIGESVKTLKVGDRVFVSHHVPCFECHYCKQGHHTACNLLHTTNFDPGGFAEYVRVPKINIEKNGVYVLDRNVSYEEGVFIEPLGCVCRAQRLANVKKGLTVLILGCGVSGLLHVQLAKLRGANKIIATDINEFRLQKAKDFGADEVFNAKVDLPDEIKKINKYRLADIVIVCTGVVSAANQALECAAPGGKIIFFAVPEPWVYLNVPINKYWRNEITITTSYGAAPEDLDEAYNWILSKRINVVDLITHRFPLSKASEAFKVVCEAGESIKVILEPEED